MAPPLGKATLKQETFWWAAPAIDRDVLQVFVIRYTWRSQGRKGIIRQEYLGPNGWVRYHTYDVIQPALTMSGLLVHEMDLGVEGNPLNESAKAVMAMLTQILERA